MNIYILLHDDAPVCAFSTVEDGAKAVFRLPEPIADECVLLALPLNPSISSQDGHVTVINTTGAQGREAARAPYLVI
jgi:hypothetical protein